MMERKSNINRVTKETQISVLLNIDGEGAVSIETGLPFFDHMLESFGKHAHFDLKIKAKGDLEVDSHHTVEDVGIALGQALNSALGDKKYINRFGYAVVPMDESLALCAIDISGRPYLSLDAQIENELIGQFSTDLVSEFITGFANSVGATIHLKLLEGKNVHHKIEALFKALAKATEMAVKFHSREMGVPSTKGVIE